LELHDSASARILERVHAQGFTPNEIKSKKVMPFLGCRFKSEVQLCRLLRGKLA